MNVGRKLLVVVTVCAFALPLSSAVAESDDPEWIEGHLGPRYYLVCIDKNVTDDVGCPNDRPVYYESGFVNVDQYEAAVLGFYAQACYDLNAADGLKCSGRRITWAVGRNG